MQPVSLDVIVPRLVVLDRTPEGMAVAGQMLDAGGLREKYEAEFAGYPKDVWDEHQRLLRWLTRLSRDYHRRIIIRVIDPRSFMGLFKSLRHLVVRYPTFIVGGRDKVTGWDEDAVESLLIKHLSSPAEV